jgi:quinol monooxygenase YgiN
MLHSHFKSPLLIQNQMKRINHFVAAGLFACVFLFASGCKTEPKVAETPIPSTSFKFSMVKHTVKDYNAWKAVYMANDSLRDAYGISKYVIGRGTDDTTMTFVVEKISDIQKVKEFAASPGLKSAMESGGVTGTPTVAFAEMLRLDTSTNAQTNRVIISCKVKDFDAWLKVFDGEGGSVRAAHGMADRALARDLDDPNTVYIAFIITDREKANARFQSEELKKLMADSGVEGPPSFFFYTVDTSK